MSLPDARALFSIWAPDASPWSAWAKPVLFVQSDPPEPVPMPAAELTPAIASGGALARSGRAAVVVDMPGAQGIACGLVLAELGYRPVPLYNATTGQGQELIDLNPIRSGLVEGAALMQAIRLPDDAPPAFLIDSRRVDGMPAPNMYDNRWMVFPQDFPSARALMAAGLESVVAIRSDGVALKPDLRWVLRHWKREGMVVKQLDPVTGAERSLDLDTSIMAVFGDHISRWFSGLRKNSAGGFGGTVPVPQATSGGYM